MVMEMGGGVVKGWLGVERMMMKGSKQRQHYRHLALSTVRGVLRLTYCLDPVGTPPLDGNDVGKLGGIVKAARPPPST